MDIFDKVTEELCEKGIILGSASIDRGKISDVLRKHFGALVPTSPSVVYKPWSEFRESGLLFYINQVLHAFGWAITMEVDEKDHDVVTRAYPARVQYRGFNSESVDKGYKKIGAYLRDHAQELFDETLDKIKESRR